MKEKTCCFTGHRNIPNEKIEKAKNDLRETIAQLINKGITDFVCGGALGFDTLAAETVLFFRKYNTNVRLILAIPFFAQAEGWSLHETMLYELIKSKADVVHLLSEKYYSGCLQRRNRFMVDQSCCCVAYFRKNSGGTYNTVKYAREQGLNLIYI